MLVLQIHGVGKKIRRAVFGVCTLMRTHEDWTLIVNRGHFSQLKIGNDTVVVLTDVAAVKELLDKRSSTTADRPPSYVGDLVSDGLNMALASFSCVQLHPIYYPGAHHTLSSSLEDSKKSGRCGFNTASYQ
jgi:hypothetical protein